MLYLILIDVLFVAGAVYLYCRLRSFKNQMNEELRKVRDYRTLEPENMVLVKGDLKDCSITTQLVLVQADSTVVNSCVFTQKPKVKSAALEMCPTPKIK